MMYVFADIHKACNTMCRTASMADLVRRCIARIRQLILHTGHFRDPVSSAVTKLFHSHHADYTWMISGNNGAPVAEVN
jgi:hypothetical protein